jgi:cytochrome c-type biogenesis protein CcmF
MLKIWNVSLVLATGVLAILGTFLVRSGILESIHAFGASTLGIPFLILIVAMIGGSIALVASRSESLRSEHRLDSLLSREAAFLLNNLVLVALCFVVFWGTFFPLISEAVTGDEASVGPPWFNRYITPLALVLVLLSGVGPLIAWRRASLENLKRNFLWPVVLGIVAAAIAFALGVRSALAALTFATTVFVAATIAVDVVRATRARLRVGERLLPAVGGLLRRHNRRYGGFVVHLGILIIALGVTGSHAWSVQTETTLRRGETAELAGYRLRFEGLSAAEESNHFKVVGAFTVTNGRALGVLMPAKKFYPQEQAPIAYVDYRLGLKEDVYVVLGDFARDGSQATIKLQVNRLVSWIWIGGVVLTLGALLAILPDRRASA